jgi:long-subunit fatty acid transport protein
MGFKIAKNWTGGFGITPFSTVGYRITSTKTVVGTIDEFTADLTGSGGLTQFYFDNAYTLFNHLSLGFTTSYVFGTITSSETIFYENIPNVITSTETAQLNKILVDFGFQYFFNLNKKSRLSVGGVFGNTHKLNFKEEVKIIQGNGQVFEEEITQEGTFDFPLYAGGGISLDWDHKLSINADYMFRNWSAINAVNPQFSYVNTNAYRLGVEYIPGRMNEFGFMGRIAYRAGFYHEGYYVEINSKAIDETGFSVGLGIPFLKNKTSVNVSYNSGVRGSTNNGLIRERYHSVVLSFSLHDWWFLKTKYD